MGDPKKSTKKFQTPKHPWQSDRIDEEIRLTNEFGLANKKEIFKTNSLLRNWRNQAKNVLRLPEEKKKQAEEELFKTLLNLNILQKGAKLDDVLAIILPEILERRLQTQIYKKGMAKTIKQARQFIVHRKVLVNGKILSAPSYLVRKEDKLSLAK